MDEVLTVLRKLQPETRSDILRLHYEGDQVLVQDHRTQERALAEDIIYAGTNQMLKVLPFELLKQLTSKAGIVEKTGRISHYKALHQYVDDQVKLPWALSNTFSTLLADGFLCQLALVAEEVSDLEKYLKSIGDLLADIAKEIKCAPDIKSVLSWVVHHGLHSFLTQFAQQELAQWCEDSNLKVKSSSKPVLIDALINQKDVERTKKAKKAKDDVTGWGKPDMEGERPALEKGISAANVFQWYTSEELREWLRAHDAARAGKLKDLTLRTIEVLEGTYQRAPQKKRKHKKSDPPIKPKTRKVSNKKPRAKKQKLAHAPSTAMTEEVLA